MGKTNEFVSFFFTILFRHFGIQKLQKILWKNQKKLSLIVHQKTTSIGTIYMNPVTCLSKGLIDSQIVRINLTFKDVLGEEEIMERLMKIRYSSYIKPGQVLLSRIDLFNICRGVAPSSININNITPTFILKNQNLSVIENAKLSRVRQNDLPNNIRLNKKHLNQLITGQKVFYKNDIVQLVDYNNINSKTTFLYYKIDVNTSPCIIDSSTSIYESSSTPTFLPFSNFQLKNSIPEKMKNNIKRMSKICYAYQKTNNTPLIFLITGSSGNGKRLMSRTFSSLIHQNMFEIDAYQLISENPASAETKISNVFEKAKIFRNCVLYIRNSHVIGFDPYNGLDRRIFHHLEKKLSETSKLIIILSCITDKLNQMPDSIKSLALYSFSADYYEENDRANWLSNYFSIENKIINYVAKKTSGFTLAELNELYDTVKHEIKFEKDQIKIFDKAIDKRNSNFADAIGAPKIPNVKWSDVGGLEETKKTVIESIRTNLFGNRTLKRSGIILFGSPGCGKTLMAKAVATEFNIAFLSVKGPELLNKYVGQSEENLRKVFERAKQASPCVIFFDEIDSLAPNRGKNGDSGGVIDRIVSQLLAELDKLHNSPRTKVFVMGATNRPDLLDNSLLTPGRFDKMVEVKPGNDIESKTKILEAISRKMNFENDVDLREIASKLDETMSGAQLFAVISNAAMQAIIEKIESKKGEEISDDVVKVSQKHFLTSIQKLKL